MVWNAGIHDTLHTSGKPLGIVSDMDGYFLCFTGIHVGCSGETADEGLKKAGGNAIGSKEKTFFMYGFDYAGNVNLPGNILGSNYTIF